MTDSLCDPNHITWGHISKIYTCWKKPICTNLVLKHKKAFPQQSNWTLERLLHCSYQSKSVKLYVCPQAILAKLPILQRISSTWLGLHNLVSCYCWMQKSIFICISCFYQAGEMNYSVIIRGEKKKKSQSGVCTQRSKLSNSVQKAVPVWKFQLHQHAWYSPQKKMCKSEENEHLYPQVFICLAA